MSFPSFVVVFNNHVFGCPKAILLSQCAYSSRNRIHSVHLGASVRVGMMVPAANSAAELSEITIGHGTPH